MEGDSTTDYGRLFPISTILTILEKEISVLISSLALFLNMPRMELALLIFAAMGLSKLRSLSIMTLISFSCNMLYSGARSFLT